MLRVESDSEPGKFKVRLDSSVFNLLLAALTGFLKSYPILRGLIAGLGLIVSVGGALLFFAGSFDFWVGLIEIKMHKSDGPFFSLFGIGLILLAFLATDKFTLYIGNSIEAEERERAEEVAGDSPDPFSSLVLAQKRLNEYYAINQSQARGSFRWAVFAMFIGLSTIVAGVWIFYLNETPNTFLTSLSTAAGVVVNAISGLYLYLHNRTQRRALFYYNQLVRIQNLGLAIRLAESHEDQADKTAAKNRVIEDILTVIRITATEESKALAAESE